MLFHELVLAAPSGQAAIDFDSMAIKWCTHVNGTTILPKLPVYLRRHFNDWERNQKVRKAVGGAAAQVVHLKALNRATAPAPLPAPAPAAPTGTTLVSASPTVGNSPALATSTTATAATPTLAAAPTLAASALANHGLANVGMPVATTYPSVPGAAPVNYSLASAGRGRGRGAVAAGAVAAAGPSIQVVIGAPPFLHAPMPSAPSAMRAGPQVVGGMLIGATQPAQPPPASAQPRRIGQRGTDQRARAPRTCKTCSVEGCPGARRKHECPQYGASTIDAPGAGHN
jgi:hypothetical protein